MTLVGLIGSALIKLDQESSNRGLEGNMVWPFKKTKFSKDRREFMKTVGKATAVGTAYAVGAGALLKPEPAEARNVRRLSEDLPEAVTYANNSALRNAYMAIRHGNAYLSKLKLPHGSRTDHYIEISLGLRDRNINNLSVVSAEIMQGSPLYFLLRARMDGTTNNISGRELKEILKVNPSAEQLILGVNNIMWDTESAKRHFLNGIFEIAELNQNDIVQINNMFGYDFVCEHPHQFSNTFMGLPNERKNWILDNVIQNKIKRKWGRPTSKFNPSDKNKVWENFYWCLGLYYTEEHFDGIKGNEAGKYLTSNSIYGKLRDKVFKHRTYDGKLVSNK